MFLKKRYSKNVAKIYECPESGEKFALIAINGKMKDKLLEQFQETFKVKGDYVSTGGKVSELCIPTLLAGESGALGISAAASGTLFVATANPAALMAIENGAVSAVMGTGEIIARAPFVPAAGALMPAASPLLAYQTLSTIMVLKQFNTINEILVNAEKTINRVLQRNEATFIGELISASSRLDIIENEFSITNRFTEDMIIRLALVEDKVNPIFERYKYLYSAQNFNEDLKYEDLWYNQTDAYMSIVLSILDLRIDILRLKVTIQENPGFLKQLAENIIRKTERYERLWRDIENSPFKVEQVSELLRDAVSSMNNWQRNMPWWLGGRYEKRRELEKQEQDLLALNSYENTKDLLDIAKNASKFGELIIENTQWVTLLFWEDEFGKHSYYTNDIIIK